MWWPRLAGTLPGGARPTKAGPVPQQLPAPFGAGPKGSVRAHRTQRTPALSGFSECPAQVVDVPTTFDGPGGPIVLRVDAMVGRDGDSFLSAPYTIFDCHETGGGNRPRAFGFVNRALFIQQSGLRSEQGLLFLMALLPENDGSPNPATPITTAVRAALLPPAMEHHRVVLELCTGIGDIVASSVNTSDPFGTGEQAVGFVAKAFKRAVEAFVPGSVPFPGPLTPARARARAIVRAVYGFSAQQQAVVWRRAKNLQVYMA